MKVNTYQKAVIELVVAGAIWGISFTCTSWALQDFSPSSLIFWRFITAFIVGELIVILFQKKKAPIKNDLRWSFKAGLFLGLSILLQTYGLKYTTAINSSFITSLYVVMLPIVSSFFYKRKIRAHDIYLSLIAFAGMGFLLNISTANSIEFNIGDFLTLGCALASTFHILSISEAAKKIPSPFRFNNYQTFWSLLLICPFLLHDLTTKKQSLIPTTLHFKPILGLAILSLLVSVVAFYLQIRAQRILSATTSSLLCLLEAPYALFFAMTLLEEKLTLLQGFGVILILLSSIWSVYIDRPQDGKN